MVMSTYNCPYYTVSDFAKEWKSTYFTFDDAVNAWKTIEGAFYINTYFPGIPELNQTLESVDGIRKFRNELEKHDQNNKQIDLFWDTEFDRHIARDKKPIDNNLKTLAAISKPRLSDVPPVSLFALGAAMSDGANKYGRFNWRDTGTTASVFYDAMMRHLADWYNGEDFANDSKVNHLGHIMASCAILLDSELHGNFNDDRDKRKSDSISRNETWKTK
jgi:hypothetical protein